MQPQGAKFKKNTTLELILLPHCLRVTRALSPYHPLTMNSLTINQQINNPQIPNQHKQSSKAKITSPNEAPHCLLPKHKFIYVKRQIQPYARANFTQILSSLKIDSTFLYTTSQSDDVYRELTLLIVSQAWQWQLCMAMFSSSSPPCKRKKGSIYRWRKAITRIIPNNLY